MGDLPRYPYDWRTKTPILTRATQQWFADLSELKEQALTALDKVRMVPDRSHKRLSAMVKVDVEVDAALAGCELAQRLVAARAAHIHEGARGRGHVAAARRRPAVEVQLGPAK